MISDNERVDGSWELTISIPDIKEEVKVRVKGDLHVGGVMHKSVENLEKKFDWSDHMLWWSNRNIWLSHTRTTLDQYGVQSDSKLELIKVHNNLTVLLPSLAQISVAVNFSTDVFSVVIRICKELSIRFPEELSLQIPLIKNDLKTNNTLAMVKSRLFLNQPDGKPVSKDYPTPEPMSPTGTPSTLKYGTLTPNYGGTISAVGTINKSVGSHIGVQSCNSLTFDENDSLNLAECSKLSSKSVFEKELLLCPKNLIQKGRMNCSWLDSSRSLMEQGIKPDYNALLHLRFKFNLFYDLNPKYDTVRIHQLFEQAKWELLSNRISATEDEMVVFAALQLQAELRTENSFKEENSHTLKSSHDTVDYSNGADDEVDHMLSELEEMCLGDLSMVDGHGIQEQRLEGSIRVYKVNKLGMKNQKRLWCVLQKQQLNMYLSKDESSQTVMEFFVPSCQIKPEVNVSTNKFFIRINSTKSDDIRLQFDNKDDYANWMAAIRLVIRRKTLTNKNLFQKEINNILDVLRLQTPGPEPVLTQEDLSKRLKDIVDYVPEKIVKKTKSKEHLRQRIGESHANVRMLNLLDSKLKYIQAWQRLENFGITYVIVKCESNSKEDIMGIASNRVMFINPTSGETLSVFCFSELRSWNINWDAEKVILDFKEKKLVFKPLSTNCKTVIELIGGYVFLNQRTADKNQELNVKLFHKLTGVTS